MTEGSVQGHTLARTTRIPAGRFLLFNLASGSVFYTTSACQFPHPGPPLSPDQCSLHLMPQHHGPLGACWNSRISGPARDLLWNYLGAQNLHFHQLQGDSHVHQHLGSSSHSGHHCVPPAMTQYGCPGGQARGLQRAVWLRSSCCQ